jgi:hypothetical protein
VFPFDGIQVNWGEGLLDINFDVIFLVIESFYPERTIGVIRKKYKNAILVGYLLQHMPILNESSRNIDFLKSCDRIACPYGIDKIRYLESKTGKKVFSMPYPYDMDLRKRYIKDKKSNTIICGCSRFNKYGDRGYSTSLDFARKLRQKHKMNLIESPDYNYDKWLDILSFSDVCVDMEKQQRIGQVAIDCAIVGTLHLGGVCDAATYLWEETATNDTAKLEEFMLRYNPSYLETVFDRVKERHSYESAIKNLGSIIKG